MRILRVASLGLRCEATGERGGDGRGHGTRMDGRVKRAFSVVTAATPRSAATSLAESFTGYPYESFVFLLEELTRPA